MKIKTYITAFLLSLIPVCAFSQPNGHTTMARDTQSLSYALSHGKVHGSFRYFMMATDNREGLTDYFAQAIGGGLKYETAPWHNVKLAMGGFIHTEINESGLDRIDPASGQSNRYEIGLFDVVQPSDRHGIARLEELYLDWSHKHWEARMGKQFVNTPFLNQQDGRMRPSAVEGLWVKGKAGANTRIEMAWLWRMSPRSTRSWYSVGSSIGLYSPGVNPDGSRSQYQGQLSSLGNFLIAIHGKTGDKLEWHGWNMLTENIVNSALIELDYRYPLKGEQSLLLSAQIVRQDAVHDGGNTNSARAYITKGSHAWVFSGRAGWMNNSWEATLSYTKITNDGRYLMPREWGREPFYTFLPRERNEGFGGLDALVAMASYKLPRRGLRTFLALGYFRLPDPADFRLNKYGMPSYYQANAEIRYSFHGFLQGFDVQALISAKLRDGDLPANLKYVINKVDMVNYNLVLNYGF